MYIIKGCWLSAECPSLWVAREKDGYRKEAFYDLGAFIVDYCHPWIVLFHFKLARVRDLGRRDRTSGRKCNAGRYQRCSYTRFSCAIEDRYFGERAMSVSYSALFFSNLENENDLDTARRSGPSNFKFDLRG